MMIRSWLLAVTLGLLAAVNLGCDSIVGAQCAPGLDYCGSICCAPGYMCGPGAQCIPRPESRYDGGLPGPWPVDAGPEAGTPDAQDRLDAGHRDAEPTDGVPADAEPTDGDPDAGPTDGDPDAGPTDGEAADAEPFDGEPGDGPKDAEPADAEPVDADPADALPGDAGPSDALPSDALPGDALPGDALPGDALPGDAGPSDALPGDALPGDALPGDAGPSDALPGDALPGDALPSDGAPIDAGADAGPTDGAPADGGPIDSGPICPLGTQLCNGTCFNTQTSTTHCGGCNLSCNIFEACNAGVCAPTCTAPRTQCQQGCVYVQNDPSHCGSCGNRCTSGVCYQGGCVAPAAGHVVVIGHDMQASHPAVVALAGNSVFLPVSANLQIGTFTQRTSVGPRNGVTNLINTAGVQQGRAFTVQDFTDLEVTQRLASVDVFVIFPQDLALDIELTVWGNQWSLALRGFVRRGGTVVLFDAGGANAGAWQILQAAGLFSASARTTLTTGELLDVSAPADAIARGSPLSYPAPMVSATFTSTLTDVVVETRSLPAQPAVFHRVILP